MVKLKIPFSKRRIPEEVVIQQVQVLSQDAFIDILNITSRLPILVHSQSRYNVGSTYNMVIFQKQTPCLDSFALLVKGRLKKFIIGQQLHHRLDFGFINTVI